MRRIMRRDDANLVQRQRRFGRFAGAKVVVEGLRRAGPNPTPQKLRDALEGMTRFDLGGLTVSYSPTNHTGLDFADLSIIDASGRFRR